MILCLGWGMTEQGSSDEQAAVDSHRPHGIDPLMSLRKGEIYRNFWRAVTYCLVERQIMYCNYCGKVIQDDAAVCAYCGIRVGASVARKRLVRPRQGRKVAGVCLGCAEYFDIDVTVVRLAWLITALMTCVGFIPYIVAWIVMPEEPLQALAPAGAQHMTSV
jgi:phage shock protein C